VFGVPSTPAAPASAPHAAVAAASVVGAFGSVGPRAYAYLDLTTDTPVTLGTPQRIVVQLFTEEAPEAVYGFLDRINLTPLTTSVRGCLVL
jgi:hypothetical protein